MGRDLRHLQTSHIDLNIFSYRIKLYYYYYYYYYYYILLYYYEL